MSTEEEYLKKLVALTEDQLRWQRAAVLPEVRKTVDTALATKQLREAYERCDGETQSNDIAKGVGASPQAFSNWTRRWRDLGIAYEVEGRRIRHLTSLKSLGLPIEIEEKSSR